MDKINIEKNKNSFEVYKKINISLDCISINLQKKKNKIDTLLNELKDLSNETNQLYFEIIKNLITV